MSSIVTVTTPATSYQLTTIDDVKLELRLTEDTDDTLISGLIDQASSVIADFCNRVLVNEAVKEVFRLRSSPGCIGPRPPESLRLTRYPVSAIATVTVDGVVQDAENYEADADAGILYRLVNDHRMPWWARKVEVAYNAGYFIEGDDQPKLPPAISRAAISLVKSAWFGSDRDPLVKMEQVEDVSQTEYWVGTVPGADGSALPPEITAPLQRYVKADR